MLTLSTRVLTMCSGVYDERCTRGYPKSSFSQDINQTSADKSSIPIHVQGGLVHPYKDPSQLLHAITDILFNCHDEHPFCQCQRASIHRLIHRLKVWVGHNIQLKLILEFQARHRLKLKPSLLHAGQFPSIHFSSHINYLLS